MSLMQREALQAPALIAEQLQRNATPCQHIAAQIRAFDPALVYIVGRGTSDHAGVFAKYLIEVELGIPVAAAAPSVSSVFGQTLKLQRALVVLISQSGRSEDLLSQARAARDSGALLLALVNDGESPLAQLADLALPIGAGHEHAVAATKSYLCTLSALLQLVAAWKQDDGLMAALPALPEAMRQVQQLPAQLTAADLTDCRHCIVLGRGFGYAIAREIALKIKEVCGIQAEAFSSAEFLHGPASLLNQPLRLLDVALPDASLMVHQPQMAEFQRRGGQSIALWPAAAFVPQPRLSALLLMQRFYLDVEAVATQMGLNPDAPPGLNKVTSTR